MKKTSLLLVFFTYFNSALFANSDTLLIRESFLSYKASNAFSHSILIGANYTLPHINKNKSSIDPLIKMQGEKGYNIGYNFAYYFKNKNSIQLGVNYSINRINFIQDEFKSVFNGFSIVNFDGYKKTTFKYKSIEIPLITTIKLSKSSRKNNTSLLIGASITNCNTTIDSKLNYDYSNSIYYYRDSINYDFNNKIIPYLMVGVELFSNNIGNKYRFNLVYKSALRQSQEINIEHNANVSIYRAKANPFLNSISLNVSYSLFDKQKKLEKNEKDSLLKEYNNNKKTFFKLEPTFLIYHSNNLIETFLQTGYTTAMFYQINGVLHHKTMEYGAGLFAKNILNSSINDSSTHIPIKRNYPGLSLFVRKRIMLQNFNTLNIQFGSLISRLKSSFNPTSGIISNDVFLFPDFKHILSIGISHKISKNMEFGWLAGASISRGYYKSSYYPGITGSIFLSYY